MDIEAVKDNPTPIKPEWVFMSKSVRIKPTELEGKVSMREHPHF